MTHSNDGSGRAETRAAIFVDYENIYRTLNKSVEGKGAPDELIGEMIDALQRSLLEDRQTRTVVSRAYADFAKLSDNSDGIQRALYARGVEPLFVPRSAVSETVELQLCVDSMDLLHHRSDISMFVLLTGRRTYLPLVQVFKRYGRQVLVVGMDDPQAADGEPHLDVETFFPARDLLSTASRRAFHAIDPAAPQAASIRHFDGNHTLIRDPNLILALQIIEEHFGQYEEVYLTPLLRKMSDLLDEDECDPKEIVSELEDHEAVRLEKRNGMPHDYTVLIMVDTHPDVARIKEDYQRTVLNARRDGEAEADAYAEEIPADGN